MIRRRTSRCLTSKSETTTSSNRSWCVICAATYDLDEAALLAIPDYDSLAASQVVPRLAGLTADELEAVRAYEAAHRARRTILGESLSCSRAP